MKKLRNHDTSCSYSSSWNWKSTQPASMLISTLTTFALMLPFALAQNSTSSSNLDFGPINFASYNNYVYRDNVTSAQVVFSE